MRSAVTHFTKMSEDQPAAYVCSSHSHEMPVMMPHHGSALCGSALCAQAMMACLRAVLQCP
jgi:hypothetical protein